MNNEEVKNEIVEETKIEEENTNVIAEEMKQEENNLEYAGFGTRLAAYLFDVLAIMGKAIIAFVLLIFIGIGIHAATGSNSNVIKAIQYFLPIFICIFGMFFYRGRKDPEGRTLGRKITKTVVLKEDGSKISKGTSFLRQFLQTVFTGTFILLVINIVLMLADKKKQSLTDKVLGTVVVYK